MKINLLGIRYAVNGAGIQQMGRRRIAGKIADPFDKYCCLLADLPLEHQRGLVDLPADGVGGVEKDSEHAVNAPSGRYFPRPRELHIGLEAATDEAFGDSGQGDSGRRRKINLTWHGADLPFHRGREIVEAGRDRSAQCRKVRGYVEKNLK